MLDRFIRYIREKKLLDVNQPYLLAISGGLDSTVLAHLLHASGFVFSMAHCNFGLRGEESGEDEVFVRELARQLDIIVHVKRFDTLSFKNARGISTQMAARELRYQWFGELMDQEGFSGLLLAHHADDQLETVFLNMLRGTGIEGFYGMPDSRGYMIRPLLPFYRRELQEFALKKNYSWREDSSNDSMDYKRNFLRHKVMPSLHEFDPAAPDNLLYSFGRIKDTGRAFFYLFDTWLESNVEKEGDYRYLKGDSLLKASGQKTLLYYWLRTYGFNFSQTSAMVQSLKVGESGKTFFSGDFSVNLDREHLILGPRDADQQAEIWLDETAIEFKTDHMHYGILTLQGGVQPDSSSLNAMLDREKLRFPLQIRNWKSGDRFRPLGMKKFKKVSDFLIDLKVPLIHKRKVKVLCSEDQIVWVIGLRIDDRYKISAFTTTVLYFKKQ